MDDTKNSATTPADANVKLKKYFRFWEPKYLSVHIEMYSVCYMNHTTRLTPSSVHGSVSKVNANPNIADLTAVRESCSLVWKIRICKFGRLLRGWLGWGLGGPLPNNWQRFLTERRSSELSHAENQLQFHFQLLKCNMLHFSNQLKKVACWLH